MASEQIEFAVSHVAETRPTSTADWTRDWRLQLCILLLALGFVAVALALEIHQQRRVSIKGIPILLPEACTMKVISGIPCPGCGLTRSVISCAHGDWAGAWFYNPAGLLIFAIAAVQIPYRSLQLFRLARGWPLLRGPDWLLWYAWLIVAVMFLQWVGRLLF